MTLVLTNTDARLRSFWHPVAENGEVVAGALHRVVLLGDGYVVWRGPTGLAAFADECPHRGARLSVGSCADGVVQCAYHGWQFDHSGACVHIPALGADAKLPPSARLSSVQVREAYGLIWIAPDAPRAALLDASTEWDDPSMRQVWLPTVTIRTSAGQFLDNFCDFGHFPFVHLGTFGAGEDAFVGNYRVERHDNGYGLAYEHVANNVEDPLTRTGEHPLLQSRTMTYSYQVPFAAQLRIEYPLTGSVNAIVTWAQPVDATTTRVYTCMMRNDVPDDDDLRRAAVQYELDVLAEDIVMLENLARHGLALDNTSQVHTRADRSTVELRRCLADALTKES